MHLGLNIRTCIFWFKRDLRIRDNRAFLEAAKNCETLIPVFFVNPEIIDKYEVKGPKLNILVSALKALDQELKKKLADAFLFSMIVLKIDLKKL